MLLIPTASDDTLANGSPSRDTISGFDGDDNLVGGALNDLFREGRFEWDGPATDDLVPGTVYEFGLGDDRIWGGEGFDRLSYAGSEAPIQMFAERGIVISANGEDLIRQIELVILTPGNDRVSGGLETMAVSMREGNDILWMTEGVGFYEGGRGSDTVRAIASVGQVDINLGRLENTISGGTVVLSGFENVEGATEAQNTLVGNGRGNMLTGGDLRDVIKGGNGRDMIDGGAGRDKLNGGRGADTVMGGDGKDVILDNHGNGTYVGGDGNDRFSVSRGEIAAGAGDDRIVFKDGHKDITVSGGSGAEDYVFQPFGFNGTVRITDFDTSADRFDIAGVDGLDAILSSADETDGLRLVLATGDSTAPDGTVTLFLDGLVLADLSDGLFL